MSDIQERSVVEALHRIKVKNEQWAFKYHDLSKQYISLQEHLRDIAERSQFLKDIRLPRKEDKRVIRVPKTSNALCGWLVTRKDFNIDLCSDLFVPLPLPTHFVLHTEIFAPQ
ncbi:uncharacterized protein LOC126266548 [Aethina tumida]|uniref:uncharacterized protein LOC126266548 n=1 Tax=Aethina tumida TaxID=116153 RepID=UPI00214872F3|nr:uncharacterized protein LOC126266548 [Aethina tumida]